MQSRARDHEERRLLCLHDTAHTQVLECEAHTHRGEGKQKLTVVRELKIPVAAKAIPSKQGRLLLSARTRNFAMLILRAVASRAPYTMLTV